MADQVDGEFARLVPSNQVARRLFSRCFVYSEEQDPFHLQFMIPLASEAQAGEEPLEDSTEYDSYHSSRDDDETLRSGYFSISFESSHQPHAPPLGWKCGRGAQKLPNRGVDLLLSRPKDISSKSLAGHHFTLRLSTDVGLLMLECARTKQPQLETHIGGTWEPLPPGDERLIYQPSTIMRAGNCEFEIRYTQVSDRKAFLSRRNLYITETLKPPMPTNMSRSSQGTPPQRMDVTCT